MTDEEINYYYGKCFTRIKGEWYEFIQIHQDNNLWVVYDFDENGQPKVANRKEKEPEEAFKIICRDAQERNRVLSVTKDMLEFPLPPPHFRFDGVNTWWLSRIPIRERHKGLHKRNVRVDCPVNNVIWEQRYKFVIQHPILTLLNTPMKRVPLSYAIRKIKDGKIISFPISSQWCISPSFTKGFEYTVYRGLTPVGLLKDNMTGVAMEPLYKQELRDKIPVVTWK